MFLWWFSTGLILLADRMPSLSERAMMVLASVTAVVALAALWLTKDNMTIAGAYMSFCAGIVLWGWNEVAFLSGTITGPRRTVCPPELSGFQRFIYATQTLIYHELTIAGTAAILWLMLSGSLNMAGLWAFLLLWGMRLSAKFNIFLGVPNVTSEFLPARLAHLKSYFRTRALNLLFPISITVGSALTFWFAHLAIGAVEAGQTSQAVAFSLLTTLGGLGVLEHWFLVLPLPDEKLWRWYLRPADNVKALPVADTQKSTDFRRRSLNLAATNKEGQPVRAGKPSSSFLIHDQSPVAAGCTIGGSQS